jgi:sulfoxide reductase catalytic subunit YedY
VDNPNKSVPVLPSEITPKVLYLSRRDFMKTAGMVAASALLAACAPALSPANLPTPAGLHVSKTTDELGDPLNTYRDITNYNNYYEFSINKQSVALVSANFKTSPWSVQVYGLVANPKTYAVDDLIRKFPPQERIYRLRCVEGWSMVIPWQGFPLASLLKEVSPTSEAKFVRFQTVHYQKDMPGLNDPTYAWPYNEGLRLDEAMNELTILATGLYGEPLPPQDGAPIRLVVPWKYGFKSIKAIVKIELVATQPATLWSTAAPYEYGFYSNVNPNRPHPRWSQATERRIGELNRRPTLMFNGYGAEVADLYKDLDLIANY